MPLIPTSRGFLPVSKVWSLQRTPPQHVVTTSQPKVGPSANNMSLQYMGIAWLFITAIIWYLNFSADARRDYVGLSHVHVRLEPAPGKLHVVVTGGAGYIGSHASMLLLEEGHAVTVLDNLSRGNIGAIMQLSLAAQPNRFAFHKVDLGHRETLVGVMKSLQPTPDLVIHFAAVAYVGESMADPVLYYKNITAATTFLLDAMEQAGVKKLVYSSTCAVYGNQEVLPITEESPPKPINPYGEAKLMAENIIRANAKAHKDFEAVILRYFNVYGSDPQGRLGEYPRPELRHHGRISGACLDAALGNIPHLVIKGTQHPTRDGSCIRDYIHVTDLVGAHVLVMQHLSNPPALYDVGSGKPVSVREFVSACKQVTQKEIQVIEQAEARPGDYAEVWAKIDKITQELGWRPNYTDVAVGLQHAWAWRSRHPNGYL